MIFIVIFIISAPYLLPKLRRVARTRQESDLCKELLTRLFNHVIGCVQSQLVTSKFRSAVNRLSSPHTDRVCGEEC